MELEMPVEEYVGRRKKVLSSLKGAAAVVFAGEGAPPLKGAWVPDFNFYYLTGIRSEQGAAVVFDPKAEDPRRRCVLYLRSLDPEMEAWDGRREYLGQALRKSTGFETLMRTRAMPNLFRTTARRAKRLACLHPFAMHTSSVSPDLALFRKVAERIPGVVIEDRSDLLPSMRAVKSPRELKVMRRAISASAAGFEAVLGMLRPGVGEKQVQHTLERAFEDAGGDETAYNSIVGSGENGTVLHYMANSGSTDDGDLVVIDAGARVDGYAADITRTYPVNGRFTKEQRELYDVVLKAQMASIRAVKPGAAMSAVDAAARKVIEKAGHGDAFIHGIGHPLGIEVHDVVADGPLKPGMVVTIEPGVYYQDRGIGIRIEDDILVTKDGNRNLSSAIVKKPDDIEAAMKSRKKR